MNVLNEFVLWNTCGFLLNIYCLSREIVLLEVIEVSAVFAYTGAN